MVITSGFAQQPLWKSVFRIKIKLAKFLIITFCGCPEEVNRMFRMPYVELFSPDTLEEVTVQKLSRRVEVIVPLVWKKKMTKEAGEGVGPTSWRCK